jgi:hypothetical protein
MDLNDKGGVRTHAEGARFTTTCLLQLEKLTISQSITHCREHVVSSTCRVNYLG